MTESEKYQILLKYVEKIARDRGVSGCVSIYLKQSAIKVLKEIEGNA